MLIWHPEVHEVFRESLYYYLLTVRPYISASFAKQFGKFLSKEGLTSCCYYETLGAYDVLVRIWLPAGKEEDFEEKMRRTLDPVRQVIPFRVSSVNMYWCREQQMSKLDRKMLETVTPDLVESVQSQNPSHKVASYEKAGLFTNIKQSSNIKFFVAIRLLPSGDRTGEDELRKFVEECIESHVDSEHIMKPSLYRGYGFAWALVKAEVKVDKFFSIAPFVLDISKKLSSFGAFTTTYICSTRNTHECDDINPASIGMSRGWDLTVATIIPELYDIHLKNEFTPKLQDEIHDWIHNDVDISKLRDSERELIHCCLLAVIQGDEDTFFDGLLRLFRRLERFLRKRWAPFVESRLGKKQQTIVLKAVGISKEKPLTHLTLGELLAICAKVIDMHPKDQEEKDLVGDWQDLAELRNNAAHAGINPINSWRKMLSTLCANFNRMRIMREKVEKETEVMITKSDKSDR